MRRTIFHANQESKRFFLTATGRSVPKRTVHHTFDVLRRALLRAQQDNHVDHAVDAIATYVGHAKVSDTYWYVSATPELMGLASQCFSRFSSGGEC
jgi:integrase